MHKCSIKQFPYRNPYRENPKKINPFNKKYGVRGNRIANYLYFISLSHDFSRKRHGRRKGTPFTGISSSPIAIGRIADRAHLE
jgi:hypothetical protein